MHTNLKHPVQHILKESIIITTIITVHQATEFFPDPREPSKEVKQTNRRYQNALRFPIIQETTYWRNTISISKASATRRHACAGAERKAGPMAPVDPGSGLRDRPCVDEVITSLVWSQHENPMPILYKRISREFYRRVPAFGARGVLVTLSNRGLTYTGRTRKVARTKTEFARWIPSETSAL